MTEKVAYALTMDRMEGPYYTPGSPENNKLWAAGIPGEKLSLHGKVSDISGVPLAKAWLDFWQADGDGQYDNKGFTLRGHQYTDKDGNYSLETVVPGIYPGRSPHIHVKVRASEGAPILTTQLFFPDMPTNEGDFLFEKTLVMNIECTAQGKTGAFDLVIKKV